MSEKYEQNLSEVLPKLMFKVLKMATHIQQGFLFFRNRTVMRVYFDQEECEVLLKRMIINRDNVLRYLGRKYIPHDIKDGVGFKDQKCIQKALCKEDYTLIHIAKSEPHKIVTDTIHVLNILRSKGYNPSLNIKFIIEQIQIAYQDTLLYIEVLNEYGIKTPSSTQRYARDLKKKYMKLENVAKIKKRSVKRKFLRYFVKLGYLTWPELRRIINITDFKESNIKSVCNEIREAIKERGTEVLI